MNFAGSAEKGIFNVWRGSAGIIASGLAFFA
jgi:hypothetical protein